MSFTALNFDVDSDGIARIELNRPSQGNALNRAMAADLLAVSNRCYADSSIRAVLVTAAGRLFSGGGDLSEFSGKQAEGTGVVMEHVLAMTTDLHGAMSRFAKMNAPLVAAVQGAAGGAGMSFVAGSDMVVAAESAKFTMGYTKAGLTPDGSSTWYLARCVGLKRAVDLVLTNRLLSAAEAEAWGLVNRVVPDDQLDAEAESLARSLAAGPTVSFGAAKRLVYDGSNASVEAAMEAESLAIAQAMGRSDGREGITAFLEKRDASFEGR